MHPSHVGMDGMQKGRHMAIHKLKPLQIAHAKPGKGGNSKLYGDGGNLWLRVTQGRKDGKHISRSWIFRYIVNGREYQMGLGRLDTIDINRAREEAKRCRILLYEGKDPIKERDAERAARIAEAAKTQNITFREAVEGNPDVP